MNKIIALFTSLLLLSGCSLYQNKSNEELINDAKVVVAIIQDSWTNKESLSEYDHEQIEEFQEAYVNNIDKYQEYEDLLMSIDSLIYSYRDYFVSLGLGTDEETQEYETIINNLLQTLKKELNI